jgi:hypothetical protein
MGYAIYEVGERWGGYGVPAICEHPSCNKEIDRGVSYACGEEPFSEHGCDRYFCGEHREYVSFTDDGELCEHDIEGEDCDCDAVELCFSCSKKDKSFKSGYPYKPEHPTWIKHLLEDESWLEWRTENPERVAELKKQHESLQKTTSTQREA